MAGQLPVCPTFTSVSIRDTLVVDLVNKLPSTTTSIHWHELYMHVWPVNGELSLNADLVNLKQSQGTKDICLNLFRATFWSLSILSVNQCLGSDPNPDPDPLVRGMDSDPYPSIIKQK
jgi:hypothetical protein